MTPFIVRHRYAGGGQYFVVAVVPDRDPHGSGMTLVAIGEGGGLYALDPMEMVVVEHTGGIPDEYLAKPEAVPA